jgi:hypothetical protein
VGFGESPPLWESVCTPDFGMCIGSFLLLQAMIYEMSLIVYCLLALNFISCLLFCSVEMNQQSLEIVRKRKADDDDEMIFFIFLAL